MVDKGYYGDVDSELWDYIDFDSLGADSEFWCTEYGAVTFN